MIHRTIAAAALAATLAIAAPSAASAGTREWSRTFRHAGSTVIVPFKPKQLSCYTLPGKRLPRFVIYHGAGVGFGL